ncbi:hypothetical protein, partial [Escherichia coli]|uniref:hypothetical protein n=2 Tax=Escherichia coli TaxID=562 RepID=UPI00265BAAD9
QKHGSLANGMRSYKQHGAATVRCLLLLSQDLFCHARASVTIDEECSQLINLLQQTWLVISAGGQCRVKDCFQVVRSGMLDQFVALKTTVQSLMLPAMATIVR